MSFFDFSLQLSAARPWSFPLSSIPRVFSNVSSFNSSTIPSSPSVTSMHPSHIPMELVLEFLDAARDDFDNDAYVQLLMSCSLVCRAWSTPAQKILFSNVTLRSQRSFQLFMNAVDPSTPHGGVLGNVVKRLRVVLDHNQPSGLHPHSFALAVNACSNLSELEVSLYGCAEPGQDIVGSPDVSRLQRAAPSFDEQTISLLKSGPQIGHLHFNNWSDNQQSLFQLLDVWPSLQFLSIGGTSLQHMEDSPLPYAGSLKGLSLNFQVTPSVDVLKWLLHNSSRSLRVLHLQRDLCLEALEYLVHAHGSRLQVVSLPGFGSSEVPALLAQCEQLRELRTENPALSQSLYKHFPASIERLAFGLDRDTSLSSIIEVVKTSDSLKSLDIQLWANGHCNPLLSTLKIACTYRGIEMNTTSDLRVFRALDLTTSSTRDS
ncbi:hypothetical protein D9613_002277 [Agrocybe pediades]|uniref:F-box domain-containing protein n=1 Tax=Agrocybe pediades TaxID=84607 RepID=A0A8H4R4Z4_9AGAR|nr:hypothetical protein D9613_002277 [Agrocybe pediades]